MFFGGEKRDVCVCVCELSSSGVSGCRERIAAGRAEDGRLFSHAVCLFVAFGRGWPVLLSACRVCPPPLAWPLLWYPTRGTTTIAAVDC